MGEVKVPFYADGAYGVVSLSHENLSKEQALVALRSQMSFDELALDVERRNS